MSLGKWYCDADAIKVHTSRTNLCESSRSDGTLSGPTAIVAGLLQVGGLPAFTLI